MNILQKKPTLQKFVNVECRGVPTLLTGNEKIDNFASNKGGFVIGSAIFFTGTSGAGKTTFSVFLQKMFSEFKTALYSREMQSSAVKEQTERLGVYHENALIADINDCKNVFEFIEAIDVEKPKVIIIDSLQVILKEDCTEGKVEQELWDLIAKLRQWVYDNNAVLFVIGHVNKDGTFEGPNTIKQMFDAHMHMEFNQKKNERILSWTKNRKGDTSAKLYYSFTKNDMLFFTEDEWYSRTSDVTLCDILLSQVQKFIDSINRQHPAFKEYYEFTKPKFNKALKLKTDEEILIELFLLIHESTINYGLVTVKES